MKRSLHKITFISPTGRETVLLDWGEEVQEHPQFPGTQQSSIEQPLGALNAQPLALGNVSGTANWSRYVKHDTNEEAFSYALRADAQLQSRVTGSLKVEVKNGDTWLYEDAVLVSSTTNWPGTTTTPRTLSVFSAPFGNRRPLAWATAPGAGTQWDWMGTKWEEININWEEL